MKYPQQKKTQSIFLHHCCCSGSASGEEIADGVDLHSPDGLLEPVLLSSVTKPPPKSPTKSGSGKKKSYTAGPTKATRVVHTARRTLYTAGRPPWYNSQGQLKDAFVIGKIHSVEMRLLH